MGSIQTAKAAYGKECPTRFSIYRECPEVDPPLGTFLACRLKTLT
jgi:hypothetical protein